MGVSLEPCLKRAFLSPMLDPFAGVQSTSQQLSAHALMNTCVHASWSDQSSRLLFCSLFVSSPIFSFHIKNTKKLRQMSVQTTATREDHNRGGNMLKKFQRANCGTLHRVVDLVPFADVFMRIRVPLSKSWKLITTVTGIDVKFAWAGNQSTILLCRRQVFPAPSEVRACAESCFQRVHPHISLLFKPVQQGGAPGLQFPTWPNEAG